LKNSLGYSIFAMVLMLVGLVVLPVSAAFVPITNEMTEQSFETDDDGHTYLYVSSELDYQSRDYLVHDGDVDISTYEYDDDSWTLDGSSFEGPATREYPFQAWDYVERGWLDDGTALGQFIDFANTTSDPLEIGAESERRVFPLDVGTTNSIVLESSVPHYGTFNLTNEEFIHVTVASRQDDIMLSCSVASPEGVVYGQMFLSDGNIDVMPIRPDGPGMYILYIGAWTDVNSFCTVDVTIESVTPINFPVDTIIEGVLPGSEYIAEVGSGDLVHTETAPTAITYKFYSNTAVPERISWAMNLPELQSDVYSPYIPRLRITSDAYTMNDVVYRYTDSYNYDEDPFYFQSFQNESYYMTVMGMENVEYVLMHDVPTSAPLPINQEFYIENMQSDVTNEVFTLDLSEDSIFRVNTTAANGYSWRIYSVFDDLIYRNLGVSTNPNFQNSEVYYLPAGTYIVKARATSYSAFGHYEFNFGSVVEGTGPVSVNDGSLIGVRFDTNALDWYNVSVAFNTHDNVTVSTDVQILNTFGENVMNSDVGYGNRQSGFGWFEYPNNYTSWIESEFVDGFGIAVISPYYVQNNTAGLVSDQLFGHSLDYTVAVEDGIPWYFNDTASISIGTGWYNFTLGYPSDASEWYLLSLDCDPGTWMNVSVYVEDVSTWDCDIYQKVNYSYQYLDWDSLDDTFTGSFTTNGTFQFGSISDTVNLVFWIDRTQAVEGSFDIVIETHVTNAFDFMDPLQYMGNGAGGGVAPPVDLGLAAAGVGISAVAIVVVVVVILKKKPQLLGR